MISLLLLVAFGLDKYQHMNKRIKEMVNYLIVGGLTTVTSIVSYYLLRLAISNYMVCTVLSWIIAVLFAYVTNRIYVFQSEEKNIAKEFVGFICSRILSLLVELFSMYVLVDLIHINDRISKVVVQVVVIILNYILSKLFVFKKKNS